MNCNGKGCYGCGSPIKLQDKNGEKPIPELIKKDEKGNPVVDEKGNVEVNWETGPLSGN
jgi:hypothetical protein